MIPLSLFAIHWVDRKRGGEGMLWADGRITHKWEPGALCWTEREQCDRDAEPYRREQDCEIVEWRRTPTRQGGESGGRT